MCVYVGGGGGVGGRWRMRGSRCSLANYIAAYEKNLIKPFDFRYLFPKVTF